MVDYGIREVFVRTEMGTYIRGFLYSKGAYYLRY